MAHKITKLFLAKLCFMVFFACTNENQSTEVLRTYLEDSESGDSDATPESPESTSTEDEPFNEPISVTGSWLTNCSLSKVDQTQVRCKVSNHDSIKANKKIEVDFIFLLETVHGVEKIELSAKFNQKDQSWVANIPVVIFDNSSSEQSDSPVLNEVNSEDKKLDIPQIIYKDENYKKILILVLDNIKTI